MKGMIEDREPVKLLEIFVFHVGDSIEDAIQSDHAMGPVKEGHDACQCQNHFDGCVLK